LKAATAYSKLGDLYFSAAALKVPFALAAGIRVG